MSSFGLPDYETLRVTLHAEGAVVQVQFDRPPVNALTHTGYREVIDVFGRIEAYDTVCAVVFGATGRMFSAGADLGEVGSSDARETAWRHRDLRRAAAVVTRCSVPVVGALHGAVVGAGAILASGSDFRYAARDTFVVLPEINEGIIGGAAHLARLLPMSTVRHLALTAERLGAEDLLRFGAVQRVVDNDELEAATLEVARGLAARGPDVVRQWKDALLHIESLPADEGFLIEQGLSGELKQL